MVTDEGIFPKVGNDPIFASEVNFFARPHTVIYTGTDLDHSTDTEVTHELTAITATELQWAKYIRINVTSNNSIKGNTGGGGDAFIKFKAQTKDVGGAYSDVTTYVTLASATGNNIQTDGSSPYNVVHELTSAEKSAGIQIKLFADVILNGGTGSFTNVQIVLELS